MHVSSFYTREKKYLKARLAEKLHFHLRIMRLQVLPILHYQMLQFQVTALLTCYYNKEQRKLKPFVKPYLQLNYFIIYHGLPQKTKHLPFHDIVVFPFTCGMMKNEHLKAVNTQSPKRAGTRHCCLDPSSSFTAQ